LGEGAIELFAKRTRWSVEVHFDLKDASALQHALGWHLFSNFADLLDCQVELMM
jgi:hypothetical protein